MAAALGIDLGTKRMGVALSDSLGITAQPLATIDRHGGKRDLAAVLDLARKYSVGVIVVGLPINPDGPGAEPGSPALVAQAPAGRENPRRRTERLARTFAQSLQGASDIPVELCDESFSTVEAESVLLQADVSRRKRKAVVDKLAAAIILQRWLDARRGDTAAKKPLGS